jgi:hypothetical protein
VEAIISSPPYAETEVAHDGQSGNAGSPEVIAKRVVKREDGTYEGYGKTEGQLGAMKAGEIEAIISSPPYADALNSPENELGAMKAGEVDAVVSSPPYAETLLNDDQRQAGKGEKLRWGTNEEYGTSPGQLGTMKEQTGVDAVLSSPPYAEGGVHEISNEPDQDELARVARTIGTIGQSSVTGYGNTPGQLARLAEDNTFWHAAREIVAESYALLKPGGYAVWVVKRFIRNRQVVYFDYDWRKLCEHGGFETVMEVHASFKTNLGTHTDLVSQEDITVTRERKSFFRRLAEKKGSPPIDFETIYFMRKK